MYSANVLLETACGHQRVASLKRVYYRYNDSNGRIALYNLVTTMPKQIVRPLRVDWWKSWSEDNDEISIRIPRKGPPPKVQCYQLRLPEKANTKIQVRRWFIMRHTSEVQSRFKIDCKRWWVNYRGQAVFGKSDYILFLISNVFWLLWMISRIGHDSI